MSDHILYLIPTDPERVPATEQIAAARRLLETLLPGVAPSIELPQEVAFAFPTENYESVSCPRCHEAFELECWGDWVSRAFATKFRDLTLTVPCCGLLTSLNDLNWHGPAGFYRFAFRYDRAPVDPSPESTAQIAQALGCDVRKVWIWI
jgi:hypothetical protein